jgi:hypothetical protein
MLSPMKGPGTLVGIDGTPIGSEAEWEQYAMRYIQSGQRMPPQQNAAPPGQLLRPPAQQQQHAAGTRAAGGGGAAVGLKEPKKYPWFR